MEYARLLKHRMRGADVRYLKDALVQLGYLHRATHDRFGDDTLRAVRAYQRAHADEDGTPLAVDGLVGRKTWGAIVRSLAASDGAEAESAALPAHLGAAAARAIAAALADASPVRRAVVCEALRHACDPCGPELRQRGIYIRGGNLYNTDLTPNTITAARIESGAKKQPQYYTEPARSIMLATVAAHSETTGADCSGGIVGLLRFVRAVKPSFDANADSLCGSAHSTPIPKASLRCGDLVGRAGHVGLYVGGGYVLEWVGHRYGCQLTQLEARAAYDFANGRMRRLGAWSRYVTPKYYG